MKNGWHTSGNMRILVKDDYIFCGIDESNHRVYPYRWDKKLMIWNNVSGSVRISTFKKSELYMWK